MEQLKEAGCDRIFHEKVSSRTPEEKRIQLQAASGNPGGRRLPLHKQVGPLWKNDGRGGQPTHDLQSRGIHVKTLDGLLDTRSLGKMAPLVIGLLTGLAECERSMIVERTQESIEHRRRTGGNLGGRPGLPQIKKDHIIRLREEGNSLRQIVSLTGVSLAVVQKTCKEHQAVAA